MPLTYSIQLGPVAPPALPPIDYVITSDTEFNNIIALGAATLSGKHMSVQYVSTAELTMAARTYTTPLTISCLNSSTSLSRLRFTGSVNNVEWKQCNFRLQDWPKLGPSIIRASSGVSTGQNFTNCLFYHGYGATHDQMNPLTVYPETDAGTGSGLQNALASAFSRGGGAGIQGNLISNTFNSLLNADAGFTGRYIFDNDMIAVYADTSGSAMYTDGVPMVFARNRIQRGWAKSADFGNPHCDAYQQVATTNVLDQLWFVGNYYYGTHFVGYQGMFLSDETGAGGYKNITAIGNIMTGNSASQLNFAEGPGTGSGFNSGLGNTTINIWDGGTPGVTMKYNSLPPARPNYMGYNVVTAEQAESTGLGVELNTVVTTANIGTKMPNYANMKLATSAAALLTAAYTPDSAGADWARQFINWATTDPTQVIKWELLPAMIDYLPVTGAMVLTVITTPLQKVKGYIPTATDLAVVPNAGVEWGTFSDEAGTIAVRAFATGTGVVRRGHTIQMRKTSPATTLTAFTIGATINGYAVTANYTTV